MAWTRSTGPESGTALRNRWPLSLALAAVVTFLLLGCSNGDNAVPVTTAQSQPPELASLLPDEVARSLDAAGFVLDPDLTARVTVPSERLVGTSAEDVAVHLWVLAYPGTVEEAMRALVLPEDAVVISPSDGLVGVTVEQQVELIEAQPTGMRGEVWAEKARARATTWATIPQKSAVVTFAESEPGAEDAAASALAGQSIPPLHIRTWRLVVADPIVVLEELELHEGTHLIVLLGQFSE